MVASVCEPMTNNAKKEQKQKNEAKIEVFWSIKSDASKKKHNVTTCQKSINAAYQVQKKIFLQVIMAENSGRSKYSLD